MEIRPYRKEEREEVIRICLATASEKARTDRKHGLFTRLFYCENYLDNEHALLLCDGPVPCGYVLFAEDCAAYKEHMKPYLEQILALGGYEERALGEMAFYERFKDEYPAHLHIDILEAYTGSGNGKALIARALETMRADGVKGVILGVAKANERACRFYQACGFRILEEDDGGYAMGMSLSPAQTERIRDMEARMERTETALRQLREAMDHYASCQKDLAELRAYYEGGAWQKDYEADERGELPSGLRRGVLSQDALYDLLAETDRKDRILACAEESEEE